MAALPPAGEFRRGWRTVVGAAVGIATGTAAAPFYTLGVFMAPLGAAFGWSRTELAAATFVTTLGNILTFGPVGRLADRLGVRRIALWSLALTAASYAAFALANRSIWSFYALWLIMTVVGAGTSPVIWTRGVAGWFQRQRGLAIGLVLLGTGLTSFLAPPLVDQAIRAFGWRGGYLTLAALAAVVGLPAVFALFVEAPREAARAGPTAAPPASAQGLTLSEAMRSRQFWQIGAGIFLAGGTITAVIVHLVPMLTDAGAPRAQAVGLASTLGLAIIVGRVGVGLLVDRFFAPLVAFLAFLACAAAVLMLSHNGGGSPLGLRLCVLMIGLTAGAEVNFLTFLSSRYFGLKAYSEICGWLATAFAVGSGLAPVLAGLLYERQHGYGLALMIGAGLLAGAAALFAGLGRYPKG